MEETPSQRRWNFQLSMVQFAMVGSGGERGMESLCGLGHLCSPLSLELGSQGQTFKVCMFSWALGLWTSKLSPEIPSVRLPLGMVMKFNLSFPFTYIKTSFFKKSYFNIQGGAFNILQCQGGASPVAGALSDIPSS